MSDAKPRPFVVPQFAGKDYTAFFVAGALCATYVHSFHLRTSIN